jgi:hypothetical protein
MTTTMTAMTTVLPNYRWLLYNATGTKNDNPKLPRKVKWELIR